ncbi:DUF3313 family protein [Colwellia echini]|uniref:DUF3313 domain-containing protein n=1 Tax=Colwellia echini TaxID=1982103 RepID=A0ABY3MYW2_9GAMM|nr:DUF3313 family protein [Colwellia echini]TYK66187.1 DUF3313 domain-containing protein [Colwellia echini]
MNNKQTMKLSVIALATAMIVGCNSTAPNPSNPPEMSDGLALVKSTTSTVAYEKAGLDLSEYTKVLILPSTVAFKKDWQKVYNRSQSSPGTRVTDADVMRMKTETANILDEVFNKEFLTDKDIKIVTEVTSNTIILKPAIVNLDVTSADNNGGNSRTVTQETGGATLYLEAFDGVSGEILARVVTSAAASDMTQQYWSSGVTNKASATNMFTKWAKALVAKFEDAGKKATK